MVRKKGYFMELVLYKGRPADCTGRLEKEIRTYDLLDALGLEYWRTDHAFLRADTMEDCMVIDDCLGATVCKNLFLCNRQKTNFYLLMMPGDKPFKTKELSHQLGISRLSFASPEDMEQYLDCTPGSSSVMGWRTTRKTKFSFSWLRMWSRGSFWDATPASTPPRSSCTQRMFWKSSCRRYTMSLFMLF